MGSRIGVYADGEHVVVPIQQELDGDTIRQLQVDVLDIITKKHLKGLVIDLSQTFVLDTYLARRLFETCRMASLVGAKPIITGISTGMAISLIDLNFDHGQVETAVTLEDGLLRLRKASQSEGITEDVDVPDDIDPDDIDDDIDVEDEALDNQAQGSDRVDEEKEPEPKN